MMGLVAGLATRWAALPRLALFTIVLYAIPFCIAGMVADGGSFVAGAMQFLIVTTGTAALTLQNHRTLVAMLRAERKARALAETDVLTGRSEEHTSELQSLMRISYAVFCLKTKHDCHKK